MKTKVKLFSYTDGEDPKRLAALANLESCSQSYLIWKLVREKYAEVFGGDISHPSMRIFAHDRDQAN